MLRITLIALTLYSITLSNCFAQTSNESSENSPRFVIHLLDYLAHDYGGAVEHGKIVSQSEYEEQKEFAAKILDIGSSLTLIKNDSKIFKKITTLKSMIESRAEATDVALTARDIQKDLIVLTKITLSPSHQPSLTNGKILFSQNCISCHGQDGMGDGYEGKNLDPKPANFHNSERMSAISAFHVYNTVRLGVPGTGMVAWNNFSDKEIWDLSFYIMSLRHAQMASNAATSKINFDYLGLLEAATLSDTEIKEKITEKDDEKKNIALALFRNKNDNTSSGQFISIAKSYLNQAFTAFSEKSPKSKSMAKQFALQAYLEGIEPIEPMIKANDPSLVIKIETEMGKIRQIISSETNDIQKLQTQIDLTKVLLNETDEAIQSKELSFGVAFMGAFSIILREGFEAVLIILTLLSVIKAFGNKKAALYVHAGWSTALFLGFVAWFLSGSLMRMSGASRELLEAITSIFAVVVLLYFGFWLHRQTEISRWKNFIQEKVQGAVENKNLIGLFSIAFISVFREAFETVLFIRALWFQTNIEGKNAISLGLIAALLLIFSFSILALRYSKKIPVRELFKLSAMLTSILAFILAGKAAHSLQEAGILNVTSLPLNLRFDAIGLYPSWQTVSAQILIMTVTLALININTKKVR